MDFVENYVCSYSEEIQSAYFSKTAVTVHPCVIYFVTDDHEAKLEHRSFVILSDDRNHDASTVLAFLDKIVQKIKSIVPHVQCINYLTDSPTSQYRIKIIFNRIANHMDDFGTTATWIYTESGHGKGPCDGVGGMVKRLADEAVRMKTTEIQDADDFYN
jgi:hypothetical protein